MRTDFTAHQIDYERRHAALSERVGTLEECVTSLATLEDLQKLKVEIINALMPSVATKTDVAWLKKAFWFAAGALSTITTGLIVGFALHVAGKI